MPADPQHAAQHLTERTQELNFARERQAALETHLAERTQELEMLKRGLAQIAQEISGVAESGPPWIPTWRYRQWAKQLSELAGLAAPEPADAP